MWRFLQQKIKCPDLNQCFAEEKLTVHIHSSFVTTSNGGTTFNSAKRLLESIGLHLEEQHDQSKVEVAKCHTGYFIIFCDVMENNKSVSHLVLSYGSKILRAVGGSSTFLVDPINLDQSKIDMLKDSNAKKVANHIFKGLLAGFHENFGTEIRASFKVSFKP